MLLSDWLSVRTAKDKCTYCVKNDYLIQLSSYVLNLLVTNISCSLNITSFVFLSIQWKSKRKYTLLLLNTYLGTLVYPFNLKCNEAWTRGEPHEICPCSMEERTAHSCPCVLFPSCPISLGFQLLKKRNTKKQAGSDSPVILLSFYV